MRNPMSLQDELSDRYERLVATDAQIIDHQVVLVRDWISKRPELRAILAEAEQAEPDLDVETWRTSLTGSEEFTWSPSRTEPGRAWLVWQLMNHIADREQAGATYQVRDYGELFTDRVSALLGVKAQNNHQVQAFVQQAFGPFFHYLSDQVSLGSSVVHTLRRYKTRVEWFHDRAELYDRYTDAISGGGDGDGEKKVRSRTRTKRPPGARSERTSTTLICRASCSSTPATPPTPRPAPPPANQTSSGNPTPATRSSAKASSTRATRHPLAEASAR